jgi:hypothetical protein
MAEKKTSPRVGCWAVAFLVICSTAIFFSNWQIKYIHLHPHFQFMPPAKSNLGAIRSTEIAYFAEWNIYVGNQPLTPVSDRRCNDSKVPWNNNTRFSILGFAPEGDVQCSYSLEGSDYPTQREGVTISAECDLDGDGHVSVWRLHTSSIDFMRSGDDDEYFGKGWHVRRRVKDCPPSD